LAALIACPLGFECRPDPETRIEVGTILKVDGDFGTIAAFFKESDRPDDFPGKVFAFNHGMSFRRNEATLAQNDPNWNELRRELTLYSAIFTVVLGSPTPRVFGYLEDALGADLLPQLLYAARNILAMPQWGVATSRTNNPKTDPSVAFGELLRKRRTEQKMSQDALAAKAGYERAFISLIERGKTNPSLRSIFDICTALDIRPSVFLRRVEKAANFDLPA
jgi:DNA-binding XRE family transcriptional regulator